MGGENVIILQQRFDGTGIYSITRHYGEIFRKIGGNPKEIIIDFSALRFIRIQGVVFLRNFIQFLQRKEINIFFRGHNYIENPAIQYLDDIQFFQLHIGQCLREHAKIRETSIPLKEIADTEIVAWLDFHFLNWMQKATERNRSSLYSIKTMILEIFTNIADHSEIKFGNIAAQHYPKEKSIIIAVADWGIGIPGTVKRAIDNSLSDPEAILLATMEGISTKSRPNNRGAGLPLVIDSMVRCNYGNVTIRSQYGVVEFSEKNGTIKSNKYETGFCPGTMFEICLDTRRIVSENEDRIGDLEW